MTDVSYSKQYTGKTTHDFRYRWKYYKSNSRKFDRKFGKNIFIDSVSVTLIEKTDRSDPKKGEDYWMKTLKIMVPFALKFEDSV